MAIEFITVTDAITGTKQVYADLIAGSYAQVTKLAWGADGVLTLVEAANPLPTVQTGALPAGTNNIGDMDVATMPATDRTTDSMAVAQQSGVIMIGGTAYAVTRVSVDTASSGDHTLVAAQGAAKTILVISFWLVVAGAVTVTFASGVGTTTKLAGGLAYAANGGQSQARDEDGVINATAANALLNMNLSAAVQTSGQIKYIVV